MAVWYSNRNYPIALLSFIYKQKRLFWRYFYLFNLVVVFLDWYLTFYNYSHIQILSVFFIDSYYWSICLTYFKYIYNDFSLILDITDQIWLYFDGN